MYVPVLFFTRDRRMDWDLAIKRNSEALVEIVADLFAMLGLVGEATVSRLPWPTYRAVLRVLRPAETALRRLIVVAARGVVVKPGSFPSQAGGSSKTKEERNPAHPLLPAFRSADPHRAPAPENSQAARPAHPHVQRRQRTGDHVAAAPASNHPNATAIRRWNGQCRAPHPQARGPRGCTCRPSPPGQTTGALADAAGEVTKPELQIAAPAGPSAGLPKEGRSRSR